jgi:hypothetical protein
MAVARRHYLSPRLVVEGVSQMCRHIVYIL